MKKGFKYSEESKRKMSLAKIGRNNPMYGRRVSSSTRRKISIFHKGRIVSEETREKMSKAMKGKHHSIETIRKISVATRGLKKKPFSKEHRRKISESRKGLKLIGCKAGNWQGGKTSIGALIRASSKYIEWRNAVFVRDNYTCQLCGDKGGRLHAHHILPFVAFPKYRFLVEYGQTLCEGCHKELHIELKKVG